MNIFMFCTVVFLLTTGLTGLLLRYANHKNMLDIPNHRSSHQVPTPRGGGFSIVVMVSLGLVYLLVTEQLVPVRDFSLIFFGGVLMATLGFWDDHKDLPASWRALAQIVLAIGSTVLIAHVKTIQIGSTVYDLGWWGYLLGVLFVVWSTNLFNFMDGIDGIASIEAISIAGGAALIMGDHAQSHLLWLIVAASAGFLMWNWPPAKIFMGDAGSAFLGYVFAVLALSTSSLGLISIWVWIILGAVFLVDATVTVLRRMLRGDAWYQAHRSHAYQRLSRRWGKHTWVTILVLCVNVFWLLPIAFWCSRNPSLGWAACMLAIAPITVAVVALGAGKPE